MQKAIRILMWEVGKEEELGREQAHSEGVYLVLWV